MLSSHLARWRESDVERYDQWLLEQVRIQDQGGDIFAVPVPEYSLPIANDKSQLTREMLATKNDPRSKIETDIEKKQRELDKLAAEAAILAANGTEVTESSRQMLLDHLSQQTRDGLLEVLGEQQAARLRDILEV